MTLPHPGCFHHFSRKLFTIIPSLMFSLRKFDFLPITTHDRKTTTQLLLHPVRNCIIPQIIRVLQYIRSTDSQSNKHLETFANRIPNKEENPRQSVNYHLKPLGPLQFGSSSGISHLLVGSRNTHLHHEMPKTRERDPHSMTRKPQLWLWSNCCKTAAGPARTTETDVGATAGSTPEAD